MHISKWKKNVSSEKTPGQMVRISRKEAIILIRSLANQLETHNPNSERVEFNAQTDKGVEYFSIAVHGELPD